MKVASVFSQLLLSSYSFLVSNFFSLKSTDKMAKKSEARVGFEPLISGEGETALPTAPQPLTNWLLDDDGDL